MTSTWQLRSNRSQGLPDRLKTETSLLPSHNEPKRSPRADQPQCNRQTNKKLFIYSPNTANLQKDVHHLQQLHQPLHAADVNLKLMSWENVLKHIYILQNEHRGKLTGCFEHNESYWSKLCIEKVINASQKPQFLLRPSACSFDMLISSRCNNCRVN